MSTRILHTSIKTSEVRNCYAFLVLVSNEIVSKFILLLLGGEYVHPVYVESIPPAGGYGPPVALRQGNAAGLYDNRNYKIIRKIEHVGQDLYDYL